MSSPYTLNPQSKAAFAVSSRLISCLVTESLLRAFYLPFPEPLGQVAGALVVLSTNAFSDQFIITRTLRRDDILAIVPLHHAPVLKDTPLQSHGYPVALVDPLDMLPIVYDLVKVSPSDQDATHDPLQASILACLVPPPWELDCFERLECITDPGILWKKFVADMILPDTFRDAILKELKSSEYWQKCSYEKPPKCPSLNSPSIEWEQSLVAGHPTHPMHRSRMITSPMSDGYDWYKPVIRFVSVPRSNIDMSGDFEHEVSRLLEQVASTFENQVHAGEERVIMPVHELQIPTILSKFEDVLVLDEELHLPAYGQTSLRTVVFPDVPLKALKLSLNVKISSALRTISHFTADFGPRFSKHIIPKLSMDRRILKIESEPASAVYRGAAPEVVKHLTAIFRDQYEPRPGEAVIVCAALLETGHEGLPAGVSAVEHVFGLDTQEKRYSFMDRYIRLACEALVPPLIGNGLAFEAHAQNILVRVDIDTRQVLGFVVRDLGGLRIHPPTLVRSTGVDFEFLPEHCVATKTLDEIYPKFYHTLVHNHLQRLIRLLDMHYDGSGYMLLRKHLEAVIPSCHQLRKLWLENATVPGKCLMRMKLQGVYRDMVYQPFPNLILYKGEV